MAKTTPINKEVISRPYDIYHKLISISPAPGTASVRLPLLWGQLISISPTVGTPH